MSEKEPLRAGLEGVRNALQSELASAEGQIEELSKKKADLTNRIAAVEQVLRREFQECGPSESVGGKPRRLNERGPILRSYDVLKAAGKPLHVNEILDRLRAQGFRSNAKRPAAMLSGTLRRSRRFRAYPGDTWGLSEWADDDQKEDAET